MDESVAQLWNCSFYHFQERNKFWEITEARKGSLWCVRYLLEVSEGTGTSGSRKIWCWKCIHCASLGGNICRVLRNQQEDDYGRFSGDNMFGSLSWWEGSWTHSEVLCALLSFSLFQWWYSGENGSEPTLPSLCFVPGCVSGSSGGSTFSHESKWAVDHGWLLFHLLWSTAGWVLAVLCLRRRDLGSWMWLQGAVGSL